MKKFIINILLGVCLSIFCLVPFILSTNSAMRVANTLGLTTINESALFIVFLLLTSFIMILVLLKKVNDKVSIGLIVISTLVSYVLISGITYVLVFHILTVRQIVLILMSIIVIPALIFGYVFNKILITMYKKILKALNIPSDFSIIFNEDTLLSKIEKEKEEYNAFKKLKDKGILEYIDLETGRIIYNKEEE